MQLHLASITTLAVLMAYLNYRFIRLQTVSAIMASSLIISLLFIGLDLIGAKAVHHDIIEFVSAVHFRHIFMNMILGLMLFAGALEIDILHLRSRKWEVMILIIVSTIASTFLIGTLVYYLLSLLHLHLTYAQSLLFGALISPTDPIAVLAIFKEIGALRDLATIISVESLFNDGIGVVLFMTIYSIAFSSGHPTANGVICLFLRESVGGITCGLVLGFIAYWLMKSIDNYEIEILLTIALVIGGYTFAQYLEISGLLAMVTAGIFVGNYRRDRFMSEQTRRYLNNFWHIIDELLNAILFLMIGFAILVIHATYWQIIAAVVTIPLVLIVRYIVVAAPLTLIRPWHKTIPYSVTILTWGGLRGGLAVALALSLPSGSIRDEIMPMTYAVVLFSVLVQGMTVKPLVNRAKRVINNTT
ncbi:MAG: sodium:proton antiporter [Gammaproteobacteria bacterium]|nr:sodium:proton antiporter [Gammaproteobacteria bacterium]